MSVTQCVLTLNANWCTSLMVLYAFSCALPGHKFLCSFVGLCNFLKCWGYPGLYKLAFWFWVHKEGLVFDGPERKIQVVALNGSFVQQGCQPPSLC